MDEEVLIYDEDLLRKCIVVGNLRGVSRYLSAWTSSVQDPRNPNYDMFHLMHLAAMSERKNAAVIVVMVRIAAGASVMEIKGGALLFGVKRADVASALLACGAHVHECNYFRQTPLHCAANGDVARVFLEAGVDVEARDMHGHTPLMCVRDGSATRALLEAGADVHAEDINRSTALHTALSAERARLLVLCGADVNATNNRGDTPLHYAVDAELVRTLLEAGAHVHARNLRQQTPFLLFTNYELLALLAAGAVVDVSGAALAQRLHAAAATYGYVEHGMWKECRVVPSSAVVCDAVRAGAWARRQCAMHAWVLKNCM